jgi:lipopolysaccharide biosynthesis protein
MSLPRLDSLESIRAVLTCTSEKFQVFYENDNLNTGALVQDALKNIIGPNTEKLREADKRYRLHDLLSAMLLHAPKPLGQRYVAVCLHIVHQQGEDGVVNAAKVWLDHLFLPSPSFFFRVHLLIPDAWRFSVGSLKNTDR